jgi:hypothetical protein
MLLADLFSMVVDRMFHKDESKESGAAIHRALILDRRRRKT